MKLFNRHGAGIVTDMNEFRLYWRNTMPIQFQRFIINKATTDEGITLVGDGESNSFQRFLFVTLFHSNNLLTKGGTSVLLKRLKQQRFEERAIEKAFYLEYRAYREHLVEVLIEHNANKDRWLEVKVELTMPDFPKPVWAPIAMLYAMTRPENHCCPSLILDEDPVFIDHWDFPLEVGSDGRLSRVSAA